MGKLAVIWDMRFTRHQMGLGHPENPRRLLAIKEVLDGSGVGKELIHLEPRNATKEEISLIHDEHYIKRIEGTNGVAETHLDPDTMACAHTWDAAILAAGSAIVGIENVVKGKFSGVFAFVRPPGHHAEHARAMGFCIFNNIAIGAMYAKKSLNLNRIFIIDFDVHHGNGTQNAFYKDEDVFYFSVHRSPFYPGSGLESETGEGNGRGTNLNVPIETGSDDDTYKRVFEKKLIPAVERFRPQIILVSAGFDAHFLDPLGGMKVTTDGFRWMAQTIKDLAKENCKGKQVYLLEGGYDLRALRESVEATLEVMVA